jgi:tRNA (cytidine/uridine-2'-O-)-methyltransferase
MTLHIALIEPRAGAGVAAVARLCAETDTPLHVIGELPSEEAALASEGLDLWHHPDWFAFRDAISRPRSLYFTPEATRELSEAPFAANTVLIFGDESEGLPPRILEKHARWCFRMPVGRGKDGWATGVRAVLEAGRGASGAASSPRPSRRRRR